VVSKKEMAFNNLYSLNYILGNFYALSRKTQIDTGNCVAILPTGEICDKSKQFGCDLLLHNHLLSNDKYIH
jgi:hypothetical protein